MPRRRQSGHDPDLGATSRRLVRLGAVRLSSVRAAGGRAEHDGPETNIECSAALPTIPQTGLAKPLDLDLSCPCNLFPFRVFFSDGRQLSR